MTAKFDTEMFGKAVGEAIHDAVEPLTKRIATLENDIKALTELVAELEEKNGQGK